MKFAGSQLEPVKWTELAGWTGDDHLEAFAAYQAGCRVLRKTPRTDDSGQIHGALSNVCRKALGLRPQDSHTARAFFEQNFQPVRIARLGEAEGLLTGYFEPIVAGSRFPSPEFPIPLYRRPRDLVAAGYKPGATAFPNKGVRIGRRTANNELVPYHDRGAIEAGALDGQKLEICWLKDPFDLLAIQIEGSGRVILEDGTPVRVSYNSHNGYSYSSFERALVERNLMSRKDISKERIRAWMAAYPEEAAKARAVNRAYAFFRITGLTNEGEPVGAQGVPLTPGRSIAVDRVHEYGTPFFIEANLPIESVKPASPFRRLMIAQDTGSAIVGPARADLYLGAGDDAGRIAGRIRHPGRFVMLLPRELDMVAAGNEMPLPVPKPKIAEIEVAQTDGKGKAELAGAGAIAAGRQMPLPAPKPKLAALEVGKPDGKGKAASPSSGTIAAGRQMPSPTPKIAAIEAKDGKGKAASARPVLLPVLKPKTSEIRQETSRNKTAKAKRSPPTPARPWLAGRCRHPCRNRKPPRPKSRNKTPKAKRNPPAPARRPPPNRSRPLRRNRRPPGSKSRTGRQRQSGVRQRRRGWESGGKAGPASRLRAQELPLIALNALMPLAPLVLRASRAFEEARPFGCRLLARTEFVILR